MIRYLKVSLIFFTLGVAIGIVGSLLVERLNQPTQLPLKFDDVITIDLSE